MDISMASLQNLSKEQLAVVCQERGIEPSTRRNMIRDLQETGVQTVQTLKKPEVESGSPDEYGENWNESDDDGDPDPKRHRIRESYRAESPAVQILKEPGVELGSSAEKGTDWSAKVAPVSNREAQLRQDALKRMLDEDPITYFWLQADREAAERAERQAEREAAERRAVAEREAAERQAEREHALALAKLKHQKVNQNDSLEPRDVSLAVSPAVKFPVMDKDSDIDSFLLCFEKTCRQYHLPQTQWARHLTPGLKGKALDAYVELPPEKDEDYEEIKQAIRAKYQLTPESYRKKFRNMQKGPLDSYMDVVGRLRTTFEQWTKGSKALCVKTLSDLMVQEQLLRICPAEIRQFVLEHKPESAMQAAELAELYTQTRVSDHRRSQISNWKGGKSLMSSPAPSSSREVPKTVPGAPNTRPVPVDSRTCYSCGQPGHLRHQCPAPRRMTSTGQPASNRSSVLLVGGENRGANVNLQPVVVGTRTVTGFRDTGADVTLVRPEVIEKEDLMPGEFLCLKGVGGTRSHVPRARVFLDWGAGSGMREVGVSDEIPMPVLLGADLGTLVSYYTPTKDIPTTSTGLPDNPKVPCVNGENSSEESGEGQSKCQVEETSSILCKEVGESLVPTLVKENGVTKGVNSASNDEEVFVVTRRTTTSSEVQVLGTEQGEEAPYPSLSSNPEDSASEGSPQLSPLTTGRTTDMDSATFETALQTDLTLESLRNVANQLPVEGEKQKIYWEGGKLYREVLPTEGSEIIGSRRQLVVPSQLRGYLLKVAHEIPLAGHLGIAKTKGRLVQNFYWPNMLTDIANYCRSCAVCQKVGKTGDIHRAPLHPLPVIDEPFKRVAVDLIGPLAIPSSSGKRYILTVVDYATRYPEAVALSSIRADKVADALLGIFTRVGFPAELLSDQGPQFVSDLMQALCRKIQVTHIMASPYHPQTNGLCERFNGTLKQMLRTFVESQGKDWERYLPHLLFAYREVPQASTGFSPFELLYGRRVRGPLDLIRESWEGKVSDSEVSVVDYVLKFRDKMETLVGLVRENMAQAQQTQKQWYDRNSRERTYEIGQKVYVLLPMRQNKLQAAWEGPFPIVKRLSDVSYLVSLGEGGRQQKAFHVNMLKAHHERTAYVMPVCSRPESEEDDPLPDLLAEFKEVNSELTVNAQLSPAQVSQLQEVLSTYRARFSSQPGRTQFTVHRVDTGDHPPFKQSAYRVSLEVLADIKREVEEMLQMGVIQKSRSAWASPVVLVPKKDRTTRFCVDYRKLNALTATDAYPMPRIDELLDKLAAARYLTIMDLSRGYWQITFQRLMNDLLEGLESFAVAYLNVIAMYSFPWEEYLTYLSQIWDKYEPG